MVTENVALPGTASAPSRNPDDPFPHFRDPVATRLNIRLSTIVLGLVAMLALSFAGNLVQWYRGPVLIVMRQTAEGAHEIAYSGRDITSSKAGQTLAIGQDRITDADKTYLASEFVRSLYGHDPATISKEVERALRMMVPASAQMLMNCMKSSCEEMNLNLTKQRAESWQETWTPQEVTISPQDPYTVQIIGEQKITKVINNQVQVEDKQLRLAVKLVADPKGRDERNLRNGVLVAKYDYKELSRAAQ